MMVCVIWVGLVRLMLLMEKVLNGFVFKLKFMLFVRFE